MRRTPRTLSTPLTVTVAVTVAGLLAVPGSVGVADAMSAAPGGQSQSASSSWNTICGGYAGCNADGHGNGGYSAVSGSMYWRMYAGHNCTNYVAYRMIHNGAGTARPWTGGGNAENWGLAMKSITDHTPAVGATAWWGRDAPPVGDSGHVAYVEQIISPTQLLVSEDNYGGDFDWRIVDKSAGGWPTGFIHFADRQLTALTKPTISAGAGPAVGRAVTTTRGTYKPAATTYAYQWLLAGQPIVGATGASYTPVAGQLAKKLTVKVTAKRSGYAAASVRSLATAPVAAGTMAVTARPAIAGDPELDDVLTASGAAWSPAPSSSTYQWSADGTAIPGATAAQLTLGEAQVGHSITVAVTGVRSGYTTSTLTSAAVGPVVAGTIAVTSPFTVTGGSHPGDTLTAAAGVVDPTSATPTYQWLRAGSPIPGATGASYVLTPGDVGTRPSVLVTLRAKNYRSSTATATSPHLVTSTPALRVAVHPHRSAVTVRVHVTAPGVVAPGGHVTFTIGKRVWVVRVSDGVAAIHAHKLPMRTSAVRIDYSGTTLVDAAQEHTTVTPKRP